MNMARSTFYKRPHAGHRAAREKADTDLRVRIEDILAEFPAYGYRRVTHELRRRGLVINHKRVARVMREHALTPHRVRAWLATTNSDHKQPIYPNLRSSITPEGPDELWVADLTYIRLTTGFVFLAVVLDAWSRRVIGYAISHLLDTRLCLAALDAALDLRQPRAGLVHHSDRGVQYASRAYRSRLAAHGIRGSVSHASKNCSARSLIEFIRSSVFVVATQPILQPNTNCTAHPLPGWQRSGDRECPTGPVCLRLWLPCFGVWAAPGNLLSADHAGTA